MPARCQDVAKILMPLLKIQKKGISVLRPISRRWSRKILRRRKILIHVFVHIFMRGMRPQQYLDMRHNQNLYPLLSQILPFSRIAMQQKCFQDCFSSVVLYVGYGERENINKVYSSQIKLVINKRFYLNLYSLQWTYFLRPPLECKTNHAGALCVCLEVALFNPTSLLFH